MRETLSRQTQVEQISDALAESSLNSSPRRELTLDLLMVGFATGQHNQRRCCHDDAQDAKNPRAAAGDRLFGTPVSRSDDARSGRSGRWPRAVCLRVVAGEERGHSRRARPEPGYRGPGPLSTSAARSGAWADPGSHPPGSRPTSDAVCSERVGELRRFRELGHACRAGAGDVCAVDPGAHRACCHRTKVEAGVVTRRPASAGGAEPMSTGGPEGA